LETNPETSILPAPTRPIDAVMSAGVSARDPMMLTSLK
jgi:hypothetical protein